MISTSAITPTWREPCTQPPCPLLCFHSESHIDRNMAATLSLVVLFGVLSSTCLGIAPPYYLTTLKTQYYILPLLDYNETDLQPLLSEETFVDHYYGTHQNYQNSMADTLKAWRKDVSDYVSRITQYTCSVTIRNLGKEIHGITHSQ